MAIQTLGLTVPEKRNDPLNNPAVPLAAAADLLFLGGGAKTDADEFVNAQTALQLSTVFSCVKILAESVSSLPLQLFSKTSTGRILDTTHPLAYLLGQEVSPEMDTVSWLECMMVHLVVTGNCYSQIQRDPGGNPVALWPLLPSMTCPYRLPNKTLVYKTEDGGVARYIDARNVFHVKTFAYDGLLGMSPIMQNMRLCGSQIASEKYGSRFFANNATPSGILTTKAKIKAEDKPRMRSDWEMQQTGGSQHRINILDQDTTFTPITIPQNEAQFLELMQFNRAQIGSIYRISSHMLGSETRQTDANVESMNLQFVTSTLRPYLSKFESEITKKLLPHASGRNSDLSVSFNVAAMLRGDTVARAAWATAGKNGGWLTPNEIRVADGLNEGGEELNQFTTAVNYMNSKRLLVDTDKAPEKVTPHVP